MQPQDYYQPYQPQPQYEPLRTVDNKFLISVGVLIVIAVVLFAAAQSISSNKHTIPADRFINQQENIVQHDSWLPSFGNISSLTDRGLSSDQLTGLKYTFGLYGKQLPEGAHHVAVDENSIRTSPIDRNNPSVNRSMSYKVSIDGTSYKATTMFSILTSEVSLTLQNSDGSTVYNSGTIDINTQTPQS